MPRIFIFAICLLQVLLLRSQSIIDFYAPPYVKCKVDTVQWTIPYKLPRWYYFNTPEYSKTNGKLMHKQSGLTVEFETNFKTNISGEKFSETDFGVPKYTWTLLPDNFHPQFKTFESVKIPEMHLARYDSLGFFTIIHTNCNQHDEVKKKALTELLQTLQMVQPKEIDHAIGYPYSNRINRDSLRTLLISDYRKYMKNITYYDSFRELGKAKPDPKIIDEYFLRDLDYHFSYQTYCELKMKNARKEFTDDEILSHLFDERYVKFGGIHEAMSYPHWLSFSKYRELIAIKNRIKLKGDINDYNILKPGRTANRVFLHIIFDQYAILAEANKVNDHWHIKPCVSEQKQTCISAGADLTGNILNVEYCNDVPYLITEELGRCTEGQLNFTPELPVVSVIDYSKPESKMISFSGIPNESNYKVIVISKEFYGHPSVAGETTQMISYKLLTQTETEWKEAQNYMDNIDTRVMENNYFQQYKGLWDEDIAKSESVVPLNNRLVVGPVTFTDFDKDSKKEIWRVMISNGAVVQYEMFEETATYPKPVTLNNTWKNHMNTHPYTESLVNESIDLKFYRTHRHYRREDFPEPDDWYDVPVEVIPEERD